MDDLIKNFTPLDFGKKKRKKKKIFLAVSGLMMLFVVGVTGYYLQSRMLSYNSKASRATREGNTPRVAAKRQWEQAVRKAYEEAYSGDPNFDITKIGTQEYLNSFPPPSCEAGTPGCVASNVGGVEGNHYSVCTNGSANYYCNDGGGGGGRETIAYNNPTPTTPPDATPTTPVNTPTPTATPPFTPTPTQPEFIITPTPTPTVTPTPTATPTGTPGPTATPTEIIVASVTATPTGITSVPQAGRGAWWMFALPMVILLGGLLL